MAADIARAERAEERVGEGVEADVGIGMADQAEPVGQPHAEQHEALARGQPMDVEAEPGARAQRALEQALGAGKVLRAR